eukprot:SM000030S11373  [mRNA]  locus=s30:380763:381263:- [translate_table: standard]
MVGAAAIASAASAGLAWETNSDTLKDAFSSFGEVTDARVITDRQTGRSRGFGFVHFTEEGAAETAKLEMNGRVRSPSLTLLRCACELRAGLAAPQRPHRGGR